MFRRKSIDYCCRDRLYQMSSEIGVMTAVAEREDQRRRRASAAAEDVEEYEVEDVRDEGRLGKRRQSVFSLLNWDLWLDATKRGFNRNIDGFPHGLYIHPRDRFSSCFFVCARIPD